MGRSNETFKVLTKIEKESSPDQIQLRKEQLKISNRIGAARNSFQRLLFLNFDKISITDKKTNKIDNIGKIYYFYIL